MPWQKGLFIATAALQVPVVWFLAEHIWMLTQHQHALEKLALNVESHFQKIQEIEGYQHKDHDELQILRGRVHGLEYLESANLWTHKILK